MRFRHNNHPLKTNTRPYKVTIKSQVSPHKHIASLLFVYLYSFSDVGLTPFGEKSNRKMQTMKSFLQRRTEEARQRREKNRSKRIGQYQVYMYCILLTNNRMSRLALTACTGRPAGHSTRLVVRIFPLRRTRSSAKLSIARGS